MIAAVNLSIDSNTLIASLIWGSIGSGFSIYGWKQKESRAAVRGNRPGFNLVFYRVGPLDVIVGALLVAGMSC